MILQPNGSPAFKQHETLTRQEVQLFQDFETMLTRRRLAFQLRCRKCNEGGSEHDYCWGDNETNASQYVVECHCTKRVYKGADVKLQ